MSPTAAASTTTINNPPTTTTSHPATTINTVTTTPTTVPVPTANGKKTPPTRLKFHSSCPKINVSKMRVLKCPSSCECSDDSCQKVSNKMSCPPGCPNCQNQHFRTKKHLPQVEVKVSEVAGRGLYAKQMIKEGAFIIPYIAEVVSTDVREKRRQKYVKQGIVNYFFESGTFTLDPTKYGNDAMFANHSCTPNMFAKTWKVHGTPLNFRAIAFEAARDIQEGEELTFDYTDEYDYMPCFCKSTKCRGHIGRKPELQQPNSLPVNQSNKKNSQKRKMIDSVTEGTPKRARKN